VPNLDRDVFLWVVAHRAGWMDAVMSTLSLVGTGGRIWLAAGAALAIARRIRLWDLIALALAIALASSASSVVKHAVARERPFDAIPAVDVIGKAPKDPSFPSGHTTNAFAAATILARAVPQTAPLWWGLAIAIAYSRVYLGVHYPLDVAGGALLGIVCAMIVAAAIRRVRSFVAATLASSESRDSDSGSCSGSSPRIGSRPPRA
jgi:undecaprenyl-diphosphatase